MRTRDKQHNTFNAELKKYHAPNSQHAQALTAVRNGTNYLDRSTFGCSIEAGEIVKLYLNKSINLFFIIQRSFRCCLLLR